MDVGVQYDKEIKDKLILEQLLETLPPPVYQREETSNKPGSSTLG